MKKINKLQINPEKGMKNEELLTLRGGYSNVYCACKKDGITLCSTETGADNCGVEYGSCHQWCMYYCPSFEEAICVG